MTSLRTVLHWLDEQRIWNNAECWVLADNTVEPVVGVTWTDDGNMVLSTASVWTEPTPTPLQYGPVCDTLREHYSGGGRLIWTTKSEDVYRGSYVANAETAVFFVFLPKSVEIIETHEEKLEQRKQQAIELTKKIEESQKWPTSM